MDIRKILADLRNERERINQAIAAIEALNSDGAKSSTKERARSSAAHTPVRRRRHRMSAAGRKRLSEMMKKRWAERKKRA